MSFRKEIGDLHHYLGFLCISGTIYWKGLTEGVICNKSQQHRIRWKGVR